MLTHHFPETMSTVSRAAISLSAPIHLYWHVPRFFSRALLTNIKKTNTNVITLFALLSAAPFKYFCSTILHMTNARLKQTSGIVI